MTNGKCYDTSKKFRYLAITTCRLFFQPVKPWNLQGIKPHGRKPINQTNPRIRLFLAMGIIGESEFWNCSLPHKWESSLDDPSMHLAHLTGPITQSMQCAGVVTEELCQPRAWTSSGCIQSRFSIQSQPNPHVQRLLHRAPNEGHDVVGAICQQQFQWAHNDSCHAIGRMPYGKLPLSH